MAELTSYLGFNHDAIRQHLAVLVEAGLVAGSVESNHGRGRPKAGFTWKPAGSLTRVSRSGCFLKTCTRSGVG